MWDITCIFTPFSKPSKERFSSHVEIGNTIPWIGGIWGPNMWLQLLLLSLRWPSRLSYLQFVAFYLIAQSNPLGEEWTQKVPTSFLMSLCKPCCWFREQTTSWTIEHNRWDPQNCLNPHFVPFHGMCAPCGHLSYACSYLIPWPTIFNVWIED